MEFNQFVRRPFTVEAIEITAENIEEVASLVGKLQTKGETTFIALNRRIVPNIGRAYVGWWMTRLGDNYRCYAPKVFKGQFIEYADEINFDFSGGEEVEEEFDSADPHGMARPDLGKVEDEEEFEEVKKSFELETHGEKISDAIKERFDVV